MIDFRKYPGPCTYETIPLALLDNACVIVIYKKTSDLGILFFY